MTDPNVVFKKLAHLFAVKVKNLDVPAFRALMLEAAPIADKLNISRPFSSTSSSFLHTVVWFRHLELTKWLLAWGANPNLPNRKAVTPMHFLAENIKKDGSKEILRMLVEAGGDLHRKNKKGHTPWAIIKAKQMESHAKRYIEGYKKTPGIAKKWRSEIVDFYKGKNKFATMDMTGDAKSETSSSVHSTDASSAASGGETRAQRGKRVFKELVEMLAKQKGDVNEEEFCRKIRDNKDIIRSGHLDLNQTTSRTGASLLHACVWYMKLECVRALVEVGGADVQLQNAKGATCLHLAAERGHKDNVRRVIDIIMTAGAQKTTKTKKGKTPPDKAKLEPIAEYIRNWPYGSLKEAEEKKSKQASEKKAVVKKEEKWELDWREVEVLFKKMDHDRNRYLNYNDIKWAVGNMRHVYAERDVSNLLKSGDPDGDGQISWSEFKTVIQRYVTIRKYRV